MNTDIAEEARVAKMRAILRSLGKPLWLQERERARAEADLAGTPPGPPESPAPWPAAGDAQSACDYVKKLFAVHAQLLAVAESGRKSRNHTPSPGEGDSTE
jgi:hypothetical protein